ncbi:hypothetical protein KQ51_01377 [Candidatus Izimaplasma bacterium HR1]|uniref:hypothetical protein n=1 Tax=Candidatus Izimoplasma sp. HR1 TaxID=1541959 RepID=UPI0004F6F36B|nr:hypothetical protein KQ51_01377 [Candidatus Izimaplasma bacterium HR1]
MKIRIYNHGSNTKKFRVNNADFSFVNAHKDKAIILNGNEILEFKDQFLKKAKLDLSNYKNDIDIHALSFRVVNRGIVTIFVVPMGTQVSVY